MSQPTTGIDLNSTTPAAPTGYLNGKFASDNGTPMQNVTVAVPNTGAVNAVNTTYTLQTSDCGKLVVVNSSSPVTVTLPAAPPFSQWNCRVANIGSGTVSISPGSLHLDGGTTPLSIAQAQSCYIATDGTNYFTGRGIAGNSSTLTFTFGLVSGVTGTNVARRQLAPHTGTVSECAVIVETSDGSTSLTFRLKQNGTDIFTSDPTVAAGVAAGTVYSFTNLISSPLSVAKNDIFTLDVTSGTSNWNVTVYLRT